MIRILWGKNTIEMICPSQCIVIKGFMMSTCLFTSDANFDHLAKVVSARCLHYKSTIFPSVLKNIGGEYSETIQISYFLLKL